MAESCAEDRTCAAASVLNRLAGLVSVRLIAHLVLCVALWRDGTDNQKHSRSMEIRRMKLDPRALIVGIFCLTAAQASWAQRFGNWRTFRLVDGLPETACGSVTVSPQEKTLARHV